MEVRFYVDPVTGEPHLHRHGVTEAEAEEVLAHPTEDRPGAEGARVAIGATSSGRVLRVIYVPDPDGEGVRCDILRADGKAAVRVQAAETTGEMSQESKFPPGWDEGRVRRLLAHYQDQTEDEAVAEDEAAFEDESQTFIKVPKDLLPEVWPSADWAASAS